LWRAFWIFSALLAAPAAVAGEPYRFDAAGYLGEAGLLPDWADTMRRELEQAPALDACLADETACPSYYRGLRHLLLKAQGLPPARQISLISHYVNGKRYRNDKSARLESPLSGQEVKYRSRWATVEEFMRQGGDCEDFATTKYYLLRRLGFEADQLRVVVTWDRGERGYHAVLAVHLEETDQVLLLESDNTIRRGSRHRYRFIYSVNEESIWDHEAPRASASRIQPASLKKETPA
jgi:predicted transglutaminase-like cysteine proteinase